MAKKRGRPLGGKHPEPIRAYWRMLQREFRQQRRQIQQQLIKIPEWKPRKPRKRR